MTLWRTNKQLHHMIDTVTYLEMIDAASEILYKRVGRERE